MEDLNEIDSMEKDAAYANADEVHDADVLEAGEAQNPVSQTVEENEEATLEEAGEGEAENISDAADVMESLENVRFIDM